MSEYLIGILLSGQLLLVLWQIYKETVERREKRKQRAEETADATADVRKMVFRLYRNSMEEKIAAMYAKVDNQDPDLREALRALQDDMECYIKCGGNGIVKDMYLRLGNHVREKLGESYYILLLVDAIHNTDNH